MRSVNIGDIAAAAGVSKTTVSRVLNNRPDVDAATSARVRSLIDQLGYVRNTKALQLALGRANVVALIADFDTSPWMVEVLRGVMGILQESHFSLMLHAFPESEAETARDLPLTKRGQALAALGRPCYPLPQGER